MVVGQAEAKATLAEVVRNHIEHNFGFGGHRTANLILAGPPGSGKTHCAQSIAQVVKLPFVSIDATRLTSSPYFKEHNVVRMLMDAAGGDVERAQRGIVCIEHLDKIASSGLFNQEGRRIQESLLSILEGREEEVEVAKGTIKLDTSGLLFIGSGIFRPTPSRPVGLPAITAGDRAGTTVRPPSTPEDLIGYGFLPEFTGRFGSLITFAPLTEEELRRILVSHDRFLGECERRFKEWGVRSPSPTTASRRSLAPPPDGRAEHTACCRSWSRWRSRCPERSRARLEPP